MNGAQSALMKESVCLSRLWIALARSSGQRNDESKMRVVRCDSRVAHSLPRSLVRLAAVSALDRSIDQPISLSSAVIAFG